MEMASARRRAKLPQAAGGGGGDQQLALWAACVLLSSLSLLIAAASSGLGGAARLTLTLTAGRDREAGALVTMATGAAAVRGAAGDGTRYCDEDDDLIGSMSVDGEGCGEREPHGRFCTLRSLGCFIATARTCR